MKYLFVALLGLALGVTGAGVVLYYNPLTTAASAAPTASDRILRYSLPADVLELALGEYASVFGQGTGSESLWEETIDRTGVLGLVLRDETGEPAAIASRLLATSAETDLLLSGVLLSDHWLVTFPGQGTLFVRAEANAWPFLKETLLPVWYFDKPWVGPKEYWPTVGPGADGSGVVVGVGGAFLRREGRAVERYELTELDPRRGTAAVTGELHVVLAGESGLAR